MTSPVLNDPYQRLLALREIVAAKFDAGAWVELGMITGATERIQRHDRLLRSLRFGDEDYSGHVLTVLLAIYQANPETLKAMELFVSEKFGGGENVSSVKSSGRTVVFQPSVFILPDVAVDQNLLSVMMPFEAGLRPVFEAIEAAASPHSLVCMRADNIWEHSTVIQDIFGLIFRSWVVVCDFSGRNPNVFYEAGIAHTLGKHVVPITQNPEDIPFDLRHHRYIRYLNNVEGRAALTDELSARLNYLVAQGRS